MKIYVPKFQSGSRVYSVGYYFSREEAEMGIKFAMNLWNSRFPSEPETWKRARFYVENYEFGDFDDQFERYMNSQLLTNEEYLQKYLGTKRGDFEDLYSQS